MRRTLAFACVALPLWAGAAAAHLLALHRPGGLAADFAQPLPVASAWGSYGTTAFAILATSIAASAAVLAVVLRAQLPAARRGDRWAVLAAAMLGLGAAAAWPFVFSSDAYAYAAYGSMAERGLDPYALVPPGAHDAFMDAARVQWGGIFPVDVYGPAMLWVSRAAVRFFGGFGVAAALWALRIATALAFLGSVALLDATLAGLSERRRLLALAAYGLNPVVLWSVAEGHNDAFLLLAVAAGALATRCGFPVAGGALLGISSLLKAPGAVLAAGFVADRFWRGRAQRPQVIAATLAGLAVAVALALPPLLPALQTVKAHGRYAPTLSLQGLVGLGPAIVLALAAAGYGLDLLRRGRRQGHAWLGISLVLGLPNVYPWYALWLVPWVIAAGEGPAALALWGVTIFAVVRYLPDASGTLSGGAAVAAAVIAVSPLALALAGLRPANQKKVTAST